MKQTIILTALVLFLLVDYAQTPNNNKQVPKGGSRAANTNSQAKGSGQYHGSKDTTPGSPMGTGGAGGNEMSGSQKGSAAEEALRSTKAEQQAGSSAPASGDNTHKINPKRKATGKKNP